MTIRDYQSDDLSGAAALWNGIVAQGDSFPGDTPLSDEEADRYFHAQSRTAVAVEDGRIVGLYVLHPNNIGRCAHIANASYAVMPGLRGRGIGRALVTNSLESARALGFRGLQFNAVVASNERARALYESLGFERIGMIPGGFRNKDDVYEDMYIYYHPTE